MVMGVCVGISPACSNEESKVKSHHYPLQIESSSPTQLLLLSADLQSISTKNAAIFVSIHSDLSYKHLPNYILCSYLSAIKMWDSWVHKNFKNPDKLGVPDHFPRKDLQWSTQQS